MEAVNFLAELKKEKRIIDFSVRKEICLRPFTEIMLDENGLIYTCCPEFVKYFYIGNILENSFEDIWFGEKAAAFRKNAAPVP